MLRRSARQVALSANPTYVYAEARHAVVSCPQGQLCDPASPRSRGASGGSEDPDYPAAHALHATLSEARRVALTVPAVSTAGIRAVPRRTTGNPFPARV